MFLLCPDVLQNRLAWHRIIILSVHISGMANTPVSLSGVNVILNNNESNSIYFSSNISTFLIAALELGSLF